MFYRWWLQLKKPSNTLWVTPALGAVAAVFFAFAARLVSIWFPDHVLPEIELDTLNGLLDVVASSMLAVSTFSLSIMVSAFASASNATTPRATELVMGDDNTRMAIASFISAFIYAVIARTALGMNYYGQNGRFVLFVSTILVLGYLIFTLIRWVRTLSQLGRMGNTLHKIQDAAVASLAAYRCCPNMGATWRGMCSHQAIMLIAGKCGYLTHIDLAGLQQQAEADDFYLFIAVRPGELVMPNTVLAYVERYRLETLPSLEKYFVLNTERSHDQDPGWGLILLSETAQRALSPAVNDPGTAISVMAGMMKLLLDTQADSAEDCPVYDRLAIKPIDEGEWIRDAFAPIARDGAGVLEVNLVMQKVLQAVWQNAPEQALSEAALKMAQSACCRAAAHLGFASDVAMLYHKHAALFGANSLAVVKQRISAVE